ncbi:MAG: ketoacyl-ACP synthase III [Candidatus Sedimenticola sp. (ex Thyasira tokunagai)]
MTYAAITGWGKCIPPAKLTNSDLETLLETSNEWIVSRTGMEERRISHVPMSDLAHIACEHALAAAGKSAQEVDLIILGSCTYDEIVPNASSRVQKLLGATHAACMDINTACTSGMYCLTVATAMIKTGVAKNALVIGAEVISRAMDWSNRNVAVLFGDGAGALFLEAQIEKAGVVAESLGCFGDDRDILAVRCLGLSDTNRELSPEFEWDFSGQEIFKKAVIGMSKACDDVLEKEQLKNSEIDLVVPHQANLRIIDALGKRLNVDKDKVFINIQRYGNMSSATAIIALVEAVEEKRIVPGARVLMPAFGAGLTWCAHLIQWGERTTPIGTSDASLPPCKLTGLQLVEKICHQRASE